MPWTLAGLPCNMHFVYMFCFLCMSSNYFIKSEQNVYFHKSVLLCTYKGATHFPHLNFL
jgi:hypothetical protein